MSAPTFFGETKSVIADFSTDASANALIIGSGGCGREPALAFAMFVSAPAPAFPHAPVVSLGPSSATKDSDSSKATPFKNVFDSLTMFEDLHQQGGARQEGVALPNSSNKKGRPSDSVSGTNEIVVPQTPTPSLPTPSLVLQAVAILDAVAQTPVNNASGKNDPGTNQVAAPEAAPTQQSAESAPQPSDPSPAPDASLPHDLHPGVSLPGPLTGTLLPGPLLSDNAPTKTVVEPPVAQQSAPLTNELTDTPQPIQQPLAAKSVSMPPEPLSAELVQTRAVPREAIQVRAQQPETTLKAIRADSAKSILFAPSLPIRAAQPVVVSQARVSEPQSVTAAKVAPQTAIAPVDTSRPDDVPVLAIPAPGFVPDVSLNSTLESAPPSTPAPRPSSDNAQAETPSTSTAESTVPALTIPPAEREPAPTIASAAVAASTSLPAPLPASHEDIDRVPEPSTPLSAPAHEALATIPAPKIPLLPQAENFAFAVRMSGLETSSSHSSLTESQQPVSANRTPLTISESSVTQTKGPVVEPQASSSQQATSPVSQTLASVAQTERPDTSAHNQFDSAGVQSTPPVTAHWNDTAVLQVPELGPVTSTAETTEVAHTNLPLAAQETYSQAPELPRTQASSEILLHLTNNDQSSASIRVADRAGSVNVSVHASDPVLRESLRSNLGELSTQLDNQGWKAEVSKPAAVATHSQSQQDSHAGGQRGSQQQQSSASDRQAQRDRRANGRQWQQELDQQITGGDAHPGGNG